MLTEPLLTINEVATLLKVKDSTVRVWVHDKSLRALKFDKEWRVREADLMEFLEVRANRPPTNARRTDNPGTNGANPGTTPCAGSGHVARKTGGTTSDSRITPIRPKRDTI